MRIKSLNILKSLTLALAICLAAAPLSAIPQRPEPPRLVNDLAGIFSSSQTDALERVLVAFDDSTSNQITVVTVLDLEGYDPSEYATRIGLDWQVGTEKFDNGVVVLVKPKTDRSAGQVFIAVGYGLEGAIPDAYAKRIIENVMIPHFRGGNYYAGVCDACDMLMKLASGEISEPREADDEPSLFSVFLSFVIIFLFVLFIIAAMNNGNNGNNGGRGGNGGRRSVYTGPVIITSGRNYGGGGFGGGFGGGSFGGFGGFGGGSFGGGGAGGSW